MLSVRLGMASKNQPDAMAGIQFSLSCSSFFASPSKPPVTATQRRCRNNDSDYAGGQLHRANVPNCSIPKRREDGHAGNNQLIFCRSQTNSLSVANIVNSDEDLRTVANASSN